ncbi:hypothetical protein LTR17_001851 [Elasticomyces elasticus]|nr:hypothetical protein LTR17_001851 [Elasticomyces elasticus]
MSLEALAHQPGASTLKEREWTALGPAKDKLVEEAEALYWAALKLEITGAAHSLHTVLAMEDLPERSSDYLSLPERLPTRMLPFISAWWPFSDGDAPDAIKEDDAQEVLRQALSGARGKVTYAIALAYGSRHKSEIKTELQDKPTEYRLARMLLIGLGMLDIDKLVEYRRPQFPSQCGEPQLGIFQDRVEKLKDGRMDVQFTYLTCNDCDKVFRAAYYECNKGCRHHDWDKTEEVFAVCAQCYHGTDHDIHHLLKKPIRHPFSDMVAKQLCQCPGVENPLMVVLDFPDPEKWEELFEERQKQRRTLAGHTKSCQYLKMEDKRWGVIDTVNEQEDQEYEQSLRRRLEEQNKKYRPPLKGKILKALPKKFRSHLFPVGNTHVSVMFGPIVIENGVLE